MSGGETVLVVDDEPLVRKYVARILEDDGYEVVGAEDGQEALVLLEGREVAPACVVSDVVMPRLNGVALVEALSLRFPALPVILMSGYGTEELARRGITSPCAVLAKPFPPERLLEEVRRCLAARP